VGAVLGVGLGGEVDYCLFFAERLLILILTEKGRKYLDY
jgi:hypothetical protein